MTSLYFDDACIIDVVDGGISSASKMLCDIFSLMGFPFNPKKEQKMSQETDFLGIIHQLQDVVTKDVVRLSPRPRTLEKEGTERHREGSQGQLFIAGCCV